MHANRNRISVNTKGAWKIYAGTIPANSQPLGIVTRGHGDTGALVQMQATGIFVQVNAGVIRTLPQDKIRAAMAD